MANIKWRNDGSGLGDIEGRDDLVMHDMVYRHPIKGAKKDKNAPRKPVIMKDSASSTSIAKIQYGLSEGTIWGLVDGGKSIILDGTPLEAADGTENFKNVTYDIRLGTNDQTYMQGFPDVSNEVGIGVELKSTAPYVRAINDTQLSAIRVRLRWNGLSSTNPENGDVSGHRINYAIDLQTDGGAYVEVLNTTISDKVSTGYERTHRIDLPRATTGWQIRIRRLTANSTSEYVRDTMYVDAIAEVIDAKFNYPNTAHMGIVFDSENFRGIPKLEAHMRGMIVRIPTNYDPVTRKYVGIWDGLFKEAYTNNPAWIYYDILTAKRYGLGDRIDTNMVDKWVIYTLGVFCDQLVPDGLGGEEPRFTCNVYLQKTSDAYQVLSSLSGIFRAMAFWNGEKIILDADMPKDPVYTFSRANTVADENGICFNHTGSRLRDRHTVVKVAWDNPNNAFQTEYEYVRDEKAISKYGIRTLDLSAFGCTSQGQAQRAGLWALRTEQLETRQITFSVGLDGFLPQVADVINVADELFAGRANSGRVSNISTGRTVVTLDRDLNVKVGDVLIINGSDGKAERRVVKSVAGRKVTMVAASTKAEKQNIWALETADLKLMRFRVMSIQENGDSTFNITALQHEPKKFPAIDSGADVIPDNITSITPDVIDAPTAVTITTRHRVVQGVTVTTLVINWGQVKTAVGYDVEWRKDDGNWIRVPRTGSTTVEVEGVYAGRYTAQVRAVSAYDVSSAATFSSVTEVKGKVGLPPAIIGLTVTGILFGFDLKWSFGAGSGDAAFTEIQVASAPNVNVKQLGLYAYNTNKLQINGLMGNLSQSFRARLVDKLGFTSAWSAWVTGTTSASAAPIMDMIQGQINESSLNQALTSKIDKIETNSSSIGGINTELDKAKADIVAADKVIAANKLEAANAVTAANAEISKAKADIIAADKAIAANKLEAANAVTAANKAIADNKLIASNAVAAANKAIADNKLIASNAVAAANAEIAASKIIIDSNKAEISAAKTELNTAKTQLATAISDIGTANTKIADSKTLIDANKAKLVLTDAEVAAAKTKVTALETDYNGNKTSVSNALTVLTNKDKSLASDLSALTASYGASEAKLVQDLKVLADKDVALTNSVTTLSSNYEANKTKVATDITTLADKDTALSNLLTTLDSEYKTNKASVSSSLTTLTNKDTALTSDISKLNTKTDNTNAEISTVKGLVSDNTSSIATTKTDITAAYKQAIDDIEIGGRNYFPSLYLSDRTNWEGGSYKSPKNPIKLEPNGTYTLHIKKVDLTSGWGVLHLYTGERDAKVMLVSSVYNNGNNPRIYENLTRTFTVDETGNLWLNVYGHNITTYWTEPQIFKGTVLQDWSPSPEDVKADYTASISTESIARADADSAITSSVTALKSDYDANKASVTQSLGTLTDKDTALTNQLTALTSTVGTNTANITDNHSALVAEDKAIADSVTALDTKYEDNKTSVNSQLTALVNKDTATANQLTALDTDYKDNKTTVNNSLTALSDKDTALGNSITDLTAIVGTNTSSISAEATVRADADKVITSSVTTLKSDYDANKASVTNSLSTLTSKDTALTNSIDALTTRVGTAEGTIISNNKALVDKDKALTDSLNALTTDYNGNKTTVSNSLTALSTADTALGKRITTLDTDYKGNKTAIRNELTAVSNRVDSTASSLSTLTTTVGSNTTKISQESTARSDADTALGKRITDTDAIAQNAQSRVGTAETAISNATSAIAQQKADITTEYKQAIDDIDLNNANYFPYEFLSKPENWIRGIYYTADIRVQLEPNTTYTIRIGELLPYTGHGVFNVIDGAAEDVRYGTSGRNILLSVFNIRNNAITREITLQFTTLDSGKICFDIFSLGYINPDIFKKVQINKGVTKQDWIPSFIDAELKTVANTAAITAESTARADADKTITSSVTALKSDYDANKASVTSSLGTLTDKDTALTNQLTALTSTVGTNTANITANNNTLVAADKAIADSVTALDTEYKGNKTAVSNSLTSLSNADTALGSRITTLDTDYKGNKTAIRNELTAVSNKTNSTANSLSTLTTTVGGNTTKISQESTARSTADTALGNRITATDAIAKNAQSRVGTVETAVSNNTSAITTTNTKLEASFIIKDNFLANGHLPVTTSAYQFPNYILDKPLVIGDTYKVTIRGELSSTRSSFQLWNHAGATKALAVLAPEGNGIYTASFTYTGNPVVTGSVRIYQFNSTQSGTSTIDSIEIVRDIGAKDRDSINASVAAESKARSDADTALGSRITTLDTDYQGNKTAIRTELTAVSNKANSTANSLSTLTTTVGGNTTKISQESTARSSADTALGNRITATEAVANNAQSRVGTAETAISNATSAIATLRTDLTASYSVKDTRSTNQTPAWYQTNHPRQVVREFKTASAIGISGGGYAYLETTVKYGDASGGNVTQEATNNNGTVYIRRGSGTTWQAWVEQEDVTGSAAKVAALKTALGKDISAVDARVTAEKKVAADATSAVAKTVGTLTTTVNGHTSSIQTQQTSINGLNAQYTVKLDVGGRVSGFGLASSTTQSDFAINADKFYIAPPSGSAKGTSPFMVLTTTQTINGVSVPAGTYMQSAFIHNGSIDTAKIKDLAVSTAKIANLAVSTAKIANLAVKSAQIDNLAVTSGKIANLAVDTLQINDYAIIVPRAVNYEGKVSLPMQVEVVVHTISVDSAGGSTYISYGFEEILSIADIKKGGYVRFRIKRNGVVLKESTHAAHSTSGSSYVFSEKFLNLGTALDIKPPKGINTYEFTATLINAEYSRTTTIDKTYMQVLGVKK